MQSRLVCRDTTIFWGSCLYARSGQIAVPFKTIQQSKLFLQINFLDMCDIVCYLLLLRRGSKRINDLINHLIIYNGVCRAAPGFARVSANEIGMVIIYMLLNKVIIFISKHGYPVQLFSFFSLYYFQFVSNIGQLGQVCIFQSHKEMGEHKPFKNLSNCLTTYTKCLNLSFVKI